MVTDTMPCLQCIDDEVFNLKQLYALRKQSGQSNEDSGRVFIGLALQGFLC